MDASLDPIEPVSQRLGRFVEAQRSSWADAGRETQLFLDAAARTLEGGKWLRARFCVTGWQAVAEARGPVAAAPAADAESWEEPAVDDTEYVHAVEDDPIEGDVSDDPGHDEEGAHR